MTENDISFEIRGAIYTVYNNIGPGLLESAYEIALACELRKLNLEVATQRALPFKYDDKTLELGYRVDILVNKKVIIEVKSVESLTDIFYKQLLTYLRVSNLKLGILVNFNTINLNDNIKRVVNNL